jgi:hypothetical protein
MAEEGVSGTVPPSLPLPSIPGVKPGEILRERIL